jgi:hypothetical protein
MRLEHRNLLGLENPSDYYGAVFHYQRFNKVITILLGTPTSSLYVTITPVFYFAGGVEWVGADLCLASARDCLTLLREVLGDDAIDPDTSPLANESVLTMPYRLYVIPTRSMEIRILAGRYLETSDQNPVDRD